MAKSKNKKGAPQKFKGDLESNLKKLGGGKFSFEIAARAGYSYQFIRMWFTTDNVNDKIESKAFEYLEELVAEQKEKESKISELSGLS